MYLNADRWDEYEIVDTDNGEKLERWGDIFLIRPDPQIIFSSGRKDPRWGKAHARFVMTQGGKGEWERYREIPEKWAVGYGEYKFIVSLTGFKHTGLFPEQAVNWDYFADKIKGSQRAFNVLNLFAYTGGATLACAHAGASVCHVDAAKSMISWAKENLALSGLSSKPVRFIIDDCFKFVLREKRRGSRYDAVIMDPPSYGRGPGGEVWKVGNDLFELVRETSGLLSENAAFFHINSYTAGFSPVVFEDMLKLTVCSAKGRGGTISGELLIPVTANSLSLPCGVFARWEN